MKVLIVDDSIIVRKMVRHALEKIEIIQALDTAASAYAAKEKLATRSYDLIISDVGMPGESGVEFLTNIRKQGLTTPFVFFTGLASGSINESLDILKLGVVDIILKPEDMSYEESLQYLQKEIMPLLRRVNQEDKKTPPRNNKLNNLSAVSADLKDIECLAIGGSTGSHPPLEELLRGIGGSCHVPVLISIHIPEALSSAFAKRMNTLTKMEVKLAKIGDKVRNGHCYIAEGGKSLVVKQVDGELILDYNTRPGPGLIYPSVDELFISSSEIFKNKLLGIVLSGMGTDGTIGGKILKENKGQIFVQERESCAVFGMPGSIVENHLSDGVYEIKDIIKKLNEAWK